MGVHMEIRVSRKGVLYFIWVSNNLPRGGARPRDFVLRSLPEPRRGGQERLKNLVRNREVGGGPGVRPMRDPLRHFEELGRGPVGSGKLW